MPRRCLGNPKWVHVGIGTFEQPASSETFFVDDANLTGTTGETLKWGTAPFSAQRLRMAHPVYDPFDPGFQDDPYPAYAWLREHDPCTTARRATGAAYWA